MTKEERCKNCEHWQLGEYTQKMFCERIDDESLTDADGEEICVYTAPDFGCVLWEGKE